MKKIILLISSIIALVGKATGCNITYPYIKEPVKLSAFYLSMGADLGYSDFLPRMGVAGSFILSSNWGGSISSKTAMFRAGNLPTDYRAGASLMGDGIPEDDLTMTSVCIMREFPHSGKMLRLGFEAGPSLVSYTEAHFTPRSYSGPTFLGTPSNYSATYTRKQAMGLAFRAKIELPLTRALGCEFAVNSNVNTLRPFIGAEIYLTFGIVRPRLFVM